MKLNDNVIKRIKAQTEEAKNLGMTKLASQLEKAISNVETRDLEKDFSYSIAKLEEDVQNLLWKSAFLMGDYYDKVPSLNDLEPIIKKMAFELRSVYQKQSNSPHFGKHEPKLPGEK